MSISKKQNEPSLHYRTTSSFQKCMLKFNKWQYLHYNTTGTFFAHLLIFFRRSTVRSELDYKTTGDFNMSISKKQNEPSLHYSTTSSFQKCILKFNDWSYLHYNTTGNFFAHLLIFFRRSTVRSELHYDTTGDFNMFIFLQRAMLETTVMVTLQHYR